MSADTADLRRLRRTLAAVAGESGGFHIVEALADVWIATSKQYAEVDTGQMKARTTVVSVSESGSRAEAVVQSDVPYAGFREYGTRYAPPNPYFRMGRDRATVEAGRLGARLESELRRALSSGGVWNPRRL